MTKRKIEVCFNPENIKFYDIESSHVVVVDILRATSAICAAFANGAKSIIPIPSAEKAKEAKDKGYVVAAERDGTKLDFADFGNSPFNFTPDKWNTGNYKSNRWSFSSNWIFYKPLSSS
jgi:2-phosphosulfolactate phosphatase